MFDISLKFSVETQELINARNALQSLAQAAGELNKNQDKAAGAAERLAAANEKSAKASSDNATASKQVSDAADKVAKSTKGLAEETDAATARLQRINDQLGFLRNDLELSETGFTKSQAGVLAWAKSVGASESTIKEFAGTFDRFNKVMGEQSLDKSVNGFAMLNRQIREYEQSQKLAAEYTALTSNQVKMLARDLETLKQQNEAFGKSAGAGAAKLTENFVEAATKVNAYNEAMRQGEIAAKAKAAADVAAAKASIGVMDQAVARFRETEAEKMQIMESNRKKVNEYMMQTWAGDVGKKSSELSSMAEFYNKQAQEADKAAKLVARAKEEEVAAFRKAEQDKLQILESSRKAVNDYMMQSWAGGVGKKSDTLSQMAAQYAEEERLAAAHNTKMQQLKANADKIAADAIAYLDRETARLIATNDSLSRGFTQASANALFKYKEALELTGASAMEVKQKLYLLEQELIKKQNLSPFAKMQEDMKNMQEQTKHLARAISVQLGDVFVSLASGQNPFIVLMQQGDQIRGALQQAKDAGQDLSKAMQGAFGSMFSSFTLVGTVLKDFVVDGFRSLGNAINTIAGQSERLKEIDKNLTDGVITPLRASRLVMLEVAAATKTLQIAALGVAAVLGGILLTAFVQLSKEQDRMAQALAKTGGYFGATSEEAIALSKSLMDVGVRSSTAATVIQEMAKTGNLGKESFAGIAQAANDAQKYVGIGVDETVKKFSELIKDPIKVLNEFSAQTGLLSQEQIGAVSALLATGDAAGAQKLAIELLQQGYTDMTNEAKAGMSSMGLAMADIKTATTDMWDAFKNSAAVEVSLKGITAILKTFAITAAIGALGIKTLAVSVAALSSIEIGDSFGEIEAKMKVGRDLVASYKTETEAFIKSMQDGNAGATTSVTTLTAAQQKSNAVQAEGNKALAKFVEDTETKAKDQAKTVDKASYAAMRLAEDVKKATKDMSAETKKAFLEDEKYAAKAGEALKKYGNEWDKAQEKAKKTPKGPKPAETYKVDRSNELAETKKQFDSELKLLKDAESTKRELLKDAYAARRINYGQYVASEIELTIESQKKQLAVIEQSSDKRKEVIQDTMQAHVAAFEAELKAGGNAEKLTAKIAAELGNLARQYQTVTVETETQTQALQNATDKRFSEFYKDLAKTVNESNDSLEKFNETVDANAASRTADLDTQRQMLGVYGAEAEALKASAAAMKTYNAEIKKQATAVADNQKKIKQLEDSVPELTSFEAIAKTMSLINDRRKADAQLQQNLNDTTTKAQIDAAQAASDAIVAYNLKVFQEARDGISNALYDAIFEGGSKGGDALKQVLNNMFKNYVINMVINPIVGNVVGSVMGVIGMGQGGTEAVSGTSSLLNLASLGSTISKGTNVLGSWLGFGASAGTGITASATATGYGLASTGGGLGLSVGTGQGLGITAPASFGQAAGSSMANSFAAAAPWLAGGLVALNALGLFRSNKQVGGGLMGTLGEDQGVSQYELWRKGGTLFSGPDYSYKRTGVAEQDKALQAAYGALRNGAIDMGNSLGLATDHLKDFTVVLGTDVIHPDTGGKGIKLDGLTPEEAQAKINEALMTANNELAEQLIGTWTVTTEKVKLAFVSKKIETTNEKRSYVASEYALENEKAIDTLTRLATSLAVVNTTFDMLGYTALEASLKSGDLASKIITAFGGSEQYAQSVSSYFNEFYSETERVAYATRILTDTLAEHGMQLPTTREAYRQLVEAQDLTTEAGRANYAVLLKNAGAFAELTPAASEANKQIAGINKVFKGLNIDGKLLETKFSKQTKELFESIGVDVEQYAGSIGDVISGIISGDTKVEDAGEELTAAFVNGINQGILKAGSDAIAAQFVATVITPIIENIKAGRNALDGVDVKAGVEKAKQDAIDLNTAWNTIANEIGSGIDGLADVVVGAANNATKKIWVANKFSSGPGDDGKWVDAPGGTTTSSSGYSGSVFAIGGSPVDNRFQSPALEAFGNLATETMASNQKVSELLQKLLNPKKEYANRYLELADKLIDKQKEYNVEGRKNEIEAMKLRVADIKAVNAVVNPLIESIKTGYHSIAYGMSNKTAEFDKLADIIIARGQYDQTTGLIKYGDGGAANYAGIVGANGATSQDVVSNFLESLFAEYNEAGKSQRFFDSLKSFLNVGDAQGNDLLTDADISEATTNLANLEKELREWYIAQARVIAVEDYATNLEETAAAKKKTAELKRTGGLEDPITKLKEQFANKLEGVNNGINKALEEEIKSKRANLEKFDPDFAKKYEDWINGIVPQDFVAFQEAGKEYSKLLGYDVFGAAPLNVIQDRIKELKKVLPGLEGEITALTEEQQKYITNIEEWYKAQAELLSTEMLIDINNQIKELTASEKGPLTTIKEAIQKYIDDFKALGTYTAEVQAQIDKLSDLQLAKARKELYDQLVPEDELKMIRTTELSNQFKDLGKTLPGSTEELRNMIDAARQAGNTTLADKLLELVPAFIALQGAAGGVSTAVDTANKAFDALQRATEARIAELEKTFTATDLAMKVLEKAVDAEKKRLNEQLQTARDSVNTLKKIFDTLENGIKQLRGEVEQTKKMQADEARRVIDVANLTGVLPDADRLAEAVTTLTGSVQQGLYATAYDKSRAFLVLANDLEKLKLTAEPQLTSAEQAVVSLEAQIKQLDELLENTRKQIDELRGIDASLFGIDESITLVDAALQQLQTAAKAEEQARTQIDILKAQLEAFRTQIDALNGIDSSVKSVEDAVRDLQAAIEASKTTTVKPPDVSTITTTQGAVDAGYITSSVNDYGSYTGIGDSGYRIETTSSGATLYFPGGGSHSVQGSDAASILSSTYGLTSGGLNDTLVRTRAEGGYTPSGLTLVGEEGPELVNFKAPSMVYTAAQSANLMRGDNTELVLELQALRSEVSMLRAEARATAVNTSKTARILDDVTQGGDTLKTEVAA